MPHDESWTRNTLADVVDQTGRVIAWSAGVSAGGAALAGVLAQRANTPLSQNPWFVLCVVITCISFAILVLTAPYGAWRWSRMRIRIRQQRRQESARSPEATVDPPATVSGLPKIAPMDVTLTPRASGDRLLIKMQNNGSGGKFAVEVLSIICKEDGRAPITQSDWSVPWASNGKRDMSIAAVNVPKGQSRTLDFARYDEAAVRESRADEAGEPHWWFSSLPEPIGIMYWPPIKSGKDLSARRFYVLLRVYRSEPAHCADFMFEVGVSGSLLICNPAPIRCALLQAVWKPWRQTHYLVSVRIEILNQSARAIRMAPSFQVESDSQDGPSLGPNELRALKRATQTERDKYAGLPADLVLPAGHYIRGWVIFSIRRSKDGGKPHCTLVDADMEGRRYPIPVEPVPPLTHS